jgi:type IV secretory pathway VirB2 component (pilin)
MSISNQSGDSIYRSLGWAVELATGPAATGLAILALAGLGFAALAGSLRLSQVGRTLAGIVILFGAPQIAATLLNLRGANVAAVNADRIQSAVDQPQQAKSICWTC